MSTESSTPTTETPQPTTEAAVSTAPVSEDAVREALKQVIDPELFVNIVDLGLIYVVDLRPAAAADANAEAAEQPATGETDPSVEAKTDVTIEMTMTSPACPAGPQLIQNAKMVVGRMPGVNGVEVKLVMTPPWTPDRMTEDARDQLGIF
jgi:metal-sulfur cluster biosynthetic enzyme